MVHRMCQSPTIVPSADIGPFPTDSNHVGPDVREPSAPAYASTDEGSEREGGFEEGSATPYPTLQCEQLHRLTHVVYVVPILLNTHQINPNHHRAFIDIVVVHTSWT